MSVDVHQLDGAGPGGPGQPPATRPAMPPWRSPRRRQGSPGAGVLHRSSALPRAGVALAATVDGRQATAGQDGWVSWGWGLSGARAGGRRGGGPGTSMMLMVFAWSPWHRRSPGCVVLAGAWSDGDPVAGQDGHGDVGVGAAGAVALGGDGRRRRPTGRGWGWSRRGRGRGSGGSRC